MSNDEIEKAESEVARLKGEPTCRIIVYRDDPQFASREGFRHVYFRACADTADIAAFVREMTLRTNAFCVAIASALYELAYAYNWRGGYSVARIVVPGHESVYDITWSVPQERARGGYGRTGRWVWERES